MAKKASQKTFLLIVLGLLGLLILFKMKVVYEGFGSGTAKEGESCTRTQEGKNKIVDSCGNKLVCLNKICKRNCGGLSGAAGDNACNSDEYCGNQGGPDYCMPLNGKLKGGSKCSQNSDCIRNRCDKGKGLCI